MAKWPYQRERKLVRKWFDQHHIEIHIQRALLLHASFMGSWYRTGFSTQVPLPLSSARNSTTCLLCWLQLFPGVENSHHIFLMPRFSFQHPTSTIHRAFPLSLVYLKTQLYILLFEMYTNWSVKDQYVTKAPQNLLF